MQPPILGTNGQGKFAAYGGPDFTVDTELKCRIVAIEGSTLFVAPYENYGYLLLEGNRRGPAPGEGGYDSIYRPKILSQGTPPPPIMKLETYAVGGWPDSSDGGGTPPTVNDNNQTRPVRVGDHIRISGMYVIDYAHPMYHDVHSDSFTYMRGPFKAAYAHSEIHPYRFQGVELISNLQPGPQLFTEAHTVVAPVFPEVYSFTWKANSLFGRAGHFVDEAKRETNTASFFISAPPKPPGDFVPRLIQSEVTQKGEGTASITHKLVGDNGASVTVSVRGVDILKPLVYRAKYAVTWVTAAGANDAARRCAEIKAEIQKTHGLMAQLQQQLAGLNPRDKADAAEIKAITQQLNPLQRQIQSLNSEARSLGCDS
jgi:hypothetical protein